MLDQRLLDQEHSKFSIGVLCFLSVAYIAFGGWVTLDPDGALSAMFLSYSADDGKFELVANYGGINLGVGIFCLIAVCRPRLRALGFAPPLAINGGYLIGRTISLVLVSVPGSFVALAFAFEAFVFALSLLGLRKLRPNANLSRS